MSVQCRCIPPIPHLPLQGNTSPWSQEFGVWLCSVPTLRTPYGKKCSLHTSASLLLFCCSLVCLPISESFLDFCYLSIFVFFVAFWQWSTAPYKRTERASEISRWLDWPQVFSGCAVEVSLEKTGWYSSFGGSTWLVFLFENWVHRHRI